MLYSPFRVINTLPKGKALRKTQTEVQHHDERLHTQEPLHAGQLQHQKTRETVTFTFGGWDGKSYDGESRTARVLRTDVPGYESIRFIKVGKHLHYIDEESLRIEKATGEAHPEASWLVDVERA